MYEEVDDEGGRMRSNIYWNLVCGNALSKIRWDPVKKLVRMESMNPTSFAPDPACTQSNFSDAGYVVHRNFPQPALYEKALSGLVAACAGVERIFACVVATPGFSAPR